MKILENRGICIGLMLVLVVCGFLLGGYKGLAGAYQKASDVFFLGEDGDGVCVAKDMAERARALTHLQTVAKKYQRLYPGGRGCFRFIRGQYQYGNRDGGTVPRAGREKPFR